MRKPPSRTHLAWSKSEDQLPTEASVNTDGSEPDHWYEGWNCEILCFLVNNTYVWPHCVSMCSPNWFGRLYHKVSDVPEIREMEHNHQIIHSAGCFVKIDQESWHHAQSLHQRQIGHKKPLSVWSSKVTLETGFWMLAKLYHCENHTMALVWILQNGSHLSSVCDLEYTTTTLQCSVHVLEENWDGHKVHSP